MSNRIMIQFTAFTLGITLLAWGGLVVLAQMGFMINDHFWLWILFMVGGWSPTYMSYIVLKRNNEVSGLKEWLKNVFYAKAKLRLYLFAILVVVLDYGIQIAVSGFAEMRAVWLMFVMIPMTFFGGGLEEAGWRYILQPGLEKKYGFVVAAIVTGIIWFAWHIPLFFVEELWQAENADMWMYAVRVMGFTFFLGAITRISGKAGIFLCIVAHTLINSTAETFALNFTWAATLASSGVIIAVSLIAVWLHSRKTRILAR